MDNVTRRSNNRNRVAAGDHELEPVVKVVPGLGEGVQLQNAEAPQFMHDPAVHADTPVGHVPVWVTDEPLTQQAIQGWSGRKCQTYLRLYNENLGLEAHHTSQRLKDAIKSHLLR